MSTALPEFGRLDRVAFEREVLLPQRPAVLRGLVGHWPAVQCARESDAALGAYLAGLDSGAAVDALLLRPEHGGRIFYADEGGGFNFVRNQISLSQAIEQLQRYARFARAPALAVQSALASVCAPGFAAAHPWPVLDAAVPPRLWLGNAVTTPTHFDESANLACVVAGERCFTLFPPDQVANLYIGPLGHSPTGTPISMVDLAAPDLQRHPRFAQALAHAQTAVLGPGDALYIPPLWWHHVSSRQPLNLLVNGWWRPADLPSGLDALLHALWAFRSLPPQQRQAWRGLLDHWVFSAKDDSSAHIPAALRGLQGEMTPALAAQLREFLRTKLQD